MKGIVRVIVQICGRFFTAIAEQWKDIHEEWLFVEIEISLPGLDFTIASQLHIPKPVLDNK